MLKVSEATGGYAGTIIIRNIDSVVTKCHLNDGSFGITKSYASFRQRAAQKSSGLTFMPVIAEAA